MYVYIATTAADTEPTHHIHIFLKFAFYFICIE